MTGHLSHAFAQLQLDFVQRFVAIGLGSSSDGMNRLTNIQRRLGLGQPDEPASNPAWIKLMAEIRTATNTSEGAEIVMAAASTATPTPEHVAHGWPTVGTFSLAVNGDTAQTHFYIDRVGDTSPFHDDRLDDRRSELREVLSIARAEHPNVRWITGGSWMYSASGYRRAFPSKHLQSGVVRKDRYTFQGMSHWGQFLDYRGVLRHDRAQEFRKRLEEWDGTNPCELFPIPTLDLRSPIAVFNAY